MRHSNSYTTSSSRREAPEALMDLPPKEGVGNAGCPLHPRPRVPLCIGRTHTSKRVPRNHPTFPHAMVLTVSFVLSPVTGLFCHRRLRIKSCLSPFGPTRLRELDASVRTTRLRRTLQHLSSARRLIAHGPFANPPCHHVARLTLPRPPHPIPRL